MDAAKSRITIAFEFLIIAVSAFAFSYGLVAKGLFYSETQPVLSPFTALSLILLIIPRLARRLTETWSQPMSLALLGIVLCGNLSSLYIQLATPDLFFKAMPEVVPTSAMTSAGLILLGLYEGLISLRKTPQSAFVLDDILLHLALFPGALSLLGHLCGVDIYMSSGVDPRAGVSVLEMGLMASYVSVAFFTNPDLFLWHFLAKGFMHQLVFAILFINQYVMSFAFGVFFRSPDLNADQVGIEFYIMIAGVLATLIFLTVNALKRKDNANQSNS